MTKARFILAATLLSSLAFADVPKYVFEYQHELHSCKPSCYTAEHPKPLDTSTIRKVCGWLDFGFESQQLRNGKWTPLKWLGDTTAAPTVLTPCSLPKDSGGNWAGIVREAKAAFDPNDPANVRFVVTPGTTWSFSRNDDNVPVRQINVRVYAKDFNLRPNECGEFGNTVCEASGSSVAKALNYVAYRLDEAKKLDAKGDAKMCQVATFTAVATARGVKKLRDKKKQQKDWGEGYTYLTRWGAKLSETDAFAKIDEMQLAAEQLHKKCGGASPLVTEVPQGDSRTKPEFYIVPNPF
jgi:hypothetical protein